MYSAGIVRRFMLSKSFGVLLASHAVSVLGVARLQKMLLRVLRSSEIKYEQPSSGSRERQDGGGWCLISQHRGTRWLEDSEAWHLAAVCWLSCNLTRIASDVASKLGRLSH